MSQLQKRKESGFTIIEVLIVLAIAGLIMLIVFLAVPALQRNSRNTQRKNDVSRIGTAASDFVSNNNGTMPASGNVGTIYNAAGNLGQYAQSNITVASGQQGVLSSLSSMVIVTGAKCDTATAGATVAASSRQMAIQYMLESGGGSNTPVCTDI